MLRLPNSLKICTEKTHLKNIVIILLITGLLLIMYWQVFSDLITIWNTKEEYSYGFMIPGITLFFIWQKKKLICANKLKPSPQGIAIIIIAIIIYFIGTLADVYFLLRFSFIFIVLGLSFSILGYQITKIILTPILIIIFCFPIPPVLQASLTAQLQLLSSQIGVFFIRLCDIPVYLEGNIIDLGNYKLQVVEACSGLRYLFPLMSLAFICAYMYHMSFWKRSFIFLTSIPITVIMNSFRIAVIAILVEFWGISMAEGFIHDFEGWIVFMLCFILLFLEMWLLSWTDRKTRSWNNLFYIEMNDSVLEYHKPTITISYSLIVSIILIISAILFVKPFANRNDFIPKRQRFSDFPLTLDNLIGKTDYLDKKTVEFLDLTDYILINFSDDKQTINFYAAYYASQKHGTVPHSPKLCIPGGGWEIIELTETTFHAIEFNRVLIQKQTSQQLVYYWYLQKGKTIANENYLKWYTFIETLKNNRSDGALIRLTTRVKPYENIEEADKRLKNFMLKISDKLENFIPS